jgi:hypothetical protein
LRANLLESLLFPGFEVEGVFLSLFYDVFLQNLALKTPQSFSTDSRA